MDAIDFTYFFLVMKRTVARAMERVHAEQTRQAHHSSLAIGANATLLTRVDEVSQIVLIERLSALPNTAIVTKKGKYGTGANTLVVNPCNGSLALSQGLFTSSIIVGLLDDTGTLVAVVVGEPMSGRMWSASQDTQTTVQELNFPLKIQHGSGIPELGSERAVRVWKPQNGRSGLGLDTTVYLDRTRGHTHDRRAVLIDDDVPKMLAALAPRSGIMITGSTGLHHALVANGGDRVAGSITTAMGCTADACGALLVTRAGGVARAFKMHQSRSKLGLYVEPLLSMNWDRCLIEIDPLHPLDYDLLVTGINADVVETLIMCVTGARTPNI